MLPPLLFAWKKTGQDQTLLRKAGIQQERGSGREEGKGRRWWTGRGERKEDMQQKRKDREAGE
ncbi:MAG: hypothetical protein LKG89_06535 [Lachnospiraceae bacterium]|nr:hypothetical protein [Lachnospiraceae bacterium]